MLVREHDVVRFVEESNRIEGITRPITFDELQAHLDFLRIDEVGVADLEKFVGVVAPGKRLRNQPGMDVRVGSHLPPRGGLIIEAELKDLLKTASDGARSFVVHREYETLHPFMDGNGRSGRVLWLWQMVNQDHELSVYALRLGFLHTWYYQSLGDPR